MLRAACVSALVLLVLASVGAQGRVSISRELLQDAGQTIMQGQISAAYMHTCSIKSDGSAWCWGYNTNGQLGDGSTSDSQTPVEVLGGGSWLQISAGGFYHTCGLKTDNTAWCWGSNIDGQLGNGGIRTEFSPIPSPVAGGGTWLQITCGNYHTCGIKTDGSAWCWGYSGDGQLGNPLLTDKRIPAIVSGGGTWLQISAGVYHTCGIKADSSAWCWGLNYNDENLSPTVVDSSATWLQISAGYYHTCGIKSDQSAWCWAQIKEGRVTEFGPTVLKEYSATPTAIPGGNSWLQISVDFDLICGITSDFLAWCWGNNEYGQAGDGSSGDVKSAPVKVYGGYSWQEVSAGWEYACGITQQEEAMCWGSNDYSKLGSTGGSATMPRTVAGDGPWGQHEGQPEGTTASPPSPEDISTTSSTNIGAIVGGVVGGLALITAIAAFIIWRKRRNQNSEGSSLKHQPVASLEDPPSTAESDSTPTITSVSDKPPTRPEDSAALAQSLSSLPSMATSADPVLQWVASRPAPVAVASAAAVATPKLTTNSKSNSTLTPKDLPDHVKALEFAWPDACIISPLGSGSFGKVFLGTLNHTPVALKLLVDAKEVTQAASASAAATGSSTALSASNIAVASQAAMISEASILASLRHPNVALLVGYCMDPPCLALEYASRGSLFDLLKTATTDPSTAAELTWHRRMSMAADAAAGMLHLHTRSPPILHRDFKSPNLLVATDWTVKVTDMGLSKVTSEASHNSSTTAGGTTNPRWLAPEVLNGAKPTEASDVFSFGVVMWEILSWRLPWEEVNVWTIVGGLLGGARPEIPPLTALPGGGKQPDAAAYDAYVALMKRCWAQEPKDRPKFDLVAAGLRALAV